jgi:hypothetical protein
VSARALAVLDRLPKHLAATDPEKRFEVVVGSVVDGVETLTRQVGDVRRAHRLGEAPTPGDVTGLAAVHGIRDASWDLLLLRLTALAVSAGAVPPEPAALAPLLALPEDVLEALLADAAADSDPALLVGRPARHRPSLALRREVVRGVVLAHRLGNATTTSLLTAAAAYVGLRVEAVEHTEERWWHVATCRDSLRLHAPLDPAEPGAGSYEVEPLEDLLALEENPFRNADIEPTARRHGQGFQVVRGGIDDPPATVRVLGVGARTQRPMVVDCDAGDGLVFEGSVPEGSELRFEASGRVSLDGADVTGSSWTFHGAVFAAADSPVPGRDFRFPGAPPRGTPTPPEREARFVTTSPLPDALQDDAPFPHGAPTISPVVLRRGLSRWRVFVRPAHTFGAGGAADDGAGSWGAPPRHKAGRFDQAVFVAADGQAGTTAGDPSFRIGFAWEEREPFAVRVLLPRRFSVLDDDAGTRVREPLRRLLDRHRAAGVDVRVEYADPRWALGAGVVRDEPDEAIGTVLAGTELWPDGTPQPEA